MRKTGKPPVPPVPPLPDRVVEDLSPVVADLSPTVVAADRVVPPPILTFLATVTSCASLTRWMGDGGAVGGRKSASVFGDAGSGGNGAGVGSGHIDTASGSPSGTSTSSLTDLLVGGAGIRITGNFSPPPPPLISLTCPAFLLAKSSSLPRTFQSHLPPSSAGSWRRDDEGGRRRTVIAETSGGGRCRDRAKGFSASNAAQMRDVPCGCCCCGGGAPAATSDFELDMEVESSFPATTGTASCCASTSKLAPRTERASPMGWYRMA